MKKMLLVIGLAVMLACSAGTAGASVSVTDTSGGHNSTATLTINGTELDITLTNNDTACQVPTDVLTALFFSITGDPGLTLSSAIASSLISMSNDPATVTVVGTNQNITAFWDYENNLNLAQFPGANMGTGGAGLGVFGGPTIDGLDYCIVGDVVTGDNGKFNGDFVNNGPLVRNTVNFVLTGLPGGLTDADISGIGFQYGTSLAPTPPQVPEPGALLLLGSGLVGLALYRRRRA